MAAAVGEAISYVRIRQGEDVFWLGRGTLKAAVVGPFEVLEERPGRDLVGWRYAGPFDELPAVRKAFGAWVAPDGSSPYEHRVVAWDEVGEDEGTGIVHIAPGCGAEDFQLGKRLGLPVIAPLDEVGHLHRGLRVAVRSRRAVTSPSRSSSDLKQRRTASTASRRSRHRYPHCWRCGTPLVFRLVDEWFISMGEVYDQPRETLTTEQVDASLRYQIMEVVDQIRWIPSFGYERELDWLLNMQRLDDQQEALLGPGAADLRLRRRAARSTVVGGREELQERAIDGWEAFEGHTPHRPYVDAVAIACTGCGAPVARIRDVGNPWLDAGIVPVLARSTTARIPTTGRSGSRPTSSPRASRASSATGSTRCSR